MGGLVLFVIALMALFEWALEPLMISLQRLFTLRELIWIPLLVVVALLLSPVTMKEPLSKISVSSSTSTSTMQNSIST